MREDASHHRIDAAKVVAQRVCQHCHAVRCHVFGVAELFDCLIGVRAWQVLIPGETCEAFLHKDAKGECNSRFSPQQFYEGLRLTLASLP